MEFVPLVALGALVSKFMDFLKLVHVQDWNGAITQVSVWVAGVAAVLLAAQTDFSASMDIGGFALGDLNFASQIFFGLMATSALSVIYDFKRAIDSTDSAAMPSLTSLGSSPEGSPSE